MDDDSQAQAACSECPPGAVNYQNTLLIDIIERLLPQGLEGWREVAVEYQQGSNEANLRRGEDVCGGGGGVNDDKNEGDGGSVAAGRRWRTAIARRWQ
jgi:hypothetical protein